LAIGSFLVVVSFGLFSLGLVTCGDVDGFYFQYFIYWCLVYIHIILILSPLYYIFC